MVESFVYFWLRVLVKNSPINTTKQKKIQRVFLHLCHGCDEKEERRSTLTPMPEFTFQCLLSSHQQEAMSRKIMGKNILFCSCFVQKKHSFGSWLGRSTGAKDQHLNR